MDIGQYSFGAEKSYIKNDETAKCNSGLHFKRARRISIDTNPHNKNPLGNTY